jgi:hypothetical protein
MHPNTECGRAMYPRLSHNVLTYLNRATRARELSQQATNGAEREFHQRLESSWMTLAASSAVVERVDLFLHSMECRSLPYHCCAECNGLMVTETIEAGRLASNYRLRCRHCGAVEDRTIAKSAEA